MLGASQSRRRQIIAALEGRYPGVGFGGARPTSRHSTRAKTAASE